MDDPVAVALKRGPMGTALFVEQTPAGIRGMGRIGREMSVIHRRPLAAARLGVTLDASL